MGNQSDIGYVETQNMLEDVRQQVRDLADTIAASSQPGSFTDLTPIGPWPIATKPGKNGRVICTLRCAVPSTTVKLKVVLEEYEGTGSPVTVTWRVNSADIEIPQPTPPVFDFDFPIALYAGKKYGCIKLVAIDGTDTRTINPPVDFPDSPRAEADYLITFSTGPLFGIPSDPSCSLIGVGGAIAANTLDPDVDYKAIVTYRIWAPLTIAGAAQTWGASNVDTVVVIAKTGSLVPKHIIHVLVGVELTQVDAISPVVVNRGYVDITQTGYTPGDQINWVSNACWIGNDKAVSTGGGCTFAAGGYGVDPSLLTSLSLSIDTTTAPYTSKAAKMTVNFTHPATPVALANVKIFRKLSSEGIGAYVLFIDRTPLRHNDLLVTGAQSFVVSDGARFKPNKTYDLQVVIKAIGGLTVSFTRSSYTTGDSDDVVADVAAPSGLNTPVIDWTAAGRLRIRGMFATTDIHTQKKKYLVIYDGSNYLDIVNRAAAANDAAARFEFGLKSHTTLVDIKKKIYKNVFGSSGTIKAYWYDENDINVSSKSTDSNTLNITDMNEVMSDSYDAVRQLDVATGLRSPGNVLGNGGWKFVDNATDQQQNWARWDGLTTPLPAIGNPGYRVVTSTSAEIAYVQATHSGWLKSGTTWILIQNIKDRYDPGESHGIYILMRAGASVTVTVRLHLYNLTRAALTGTLNATSSTSCVGTGTLAGTEFVAGDYIVASSQRRKVMTITDTTHWTVDTAFSSASGALNVIIDNIEDPISQSIALTTSNQVFGARIKMKDTPDLASTPGGTDYASHQFGLEITSNTQDIYYYNFMDTRGSDIMAYAPRGSEGDVAGLHQLPPTFIAAPDILTNGIIGSLGGWKDLNSGGLIAPL